MSAPVQTERPVTTTDAPDADVVFEILSPGERHWRTLLPLDHAYWMDRLVDHATGQHAIADTVARQRLGAAIIGRLLLSGDSAPTAVEGGPAPLLRVRRRSAVPAFADTGAAREAGATRPAPRRARAADTPIMGFTRGLLVGASSAALVATGFAQAEAEGRPERGGVTLGLGVGASRLEPEPTSSLLDSETADEPAWGGFVGYEVSSRIDAELYAQDLGTAETSFSGAPLGEIDYRVAGVRARVDLGDGERRGLEPFVTLGLGRMFNDGGPQVPYRTDHDWHAAVGAGLEYGFDGGFALRGEVQGHDSDAAGLQLSLVKRVGGERAAPRVVALGPVADSPAWAEREPVAPQRKAAPPTNEPMPGEILDAVRFGFDKHRVPDSMATRLDDVAEQARGGTTTLVVEGHADSTGSEPYNQGLSERRARAVAEALVVRGVPRERILVRGFGERRPQTSNRTEEGRATNRRAVVRVGPAEGEPVLVGFVQF